MDASQIIGGAMAAIAFLAFFAMSVVPLFVKRLPETEEGAE